MSKCLFEESWDTAMMKAKVDVASIKKSTLYSSAHRRCNLLEVHIPDARFFWSWSNIWFKSECPPHVSSLAWSQETGREKEAQPFEPASRRRDHKGVMKDQICFLFPCWKLKTMKECIRFLHCAETNSWAWGISWPCLVGAQREIH